MYIDVVTVIVYTNQDCKIKQYKARSLQYKASSWNKFYHTGWSTILKKIEALDHTLWDLMRLKKKDSLNKSFGGKVVILRGDFRQISRCCCT